MTFLSTGEDVEAVADKLESQTAATQAMREQLEAQSAELAAARASKIELASEVAALRAGRDVPATALSRQHSEAASIGGYASPRAANSLSSQLSGIAGPGLSPGVKPARESTISRQSSGVASVSGSAAGKASIAGLSSGQQQSDALNAASRQGSIAGKEAAAALGALGLKRTAGSGRLTRVSAGADTGD